LIESPTVLMAVAVLLSKLMMGATPRLPSNRHLTVSPVLERDDAGAVGLAQKLPSEAVSAAGSADGGICALFIDYPLNSRVNDEVT